MSTSMNPVFFPQVSRLPQLKGQERLPAAGTPTNPSEFESTLQALREPLKFSAHATERMKERKVALTPELMARMNDALDRAESKGVEESLVISKDAAFIVSVPNRTVITAMDLESMRNNVFTNIDGAVFIG